MKVQQILDWLNSIAPFDSAESFDNVGLLMGDRNADVHAVVFGMDITASLVDLAIERGAELIITHHPFIFHALKRIDYTGPQGRALCRLAEKQISVIAAHTNWDKAPGGICDSLAAELDLSDIVSADDYVRVGNLPSPMSADQLAAFIQNRLFMKPRCYADAKAVITRVGVSGGAYGEGYEAALAAGAQAYIVGEIAHHEIIDACARGMTVYDAGHYSTEMPGVKALYSCFTQQALSAGWQIKAHLHIKAPYPGAFLAL